MEKKVRSTLARIWGDTPVIEAAAACPAKILLPNSVDRAFCSGG